MKKIIGVFSIILILFTFFTSSINADQINGHGSVVSNGLVCPIYRSWVNNVNNPNDSKIILQVLCPQPPFLSYRDVSKCYNSSTGTSYLVYGSWVTNVGQGSEADCNNGDSITNAYIKDSSGFRQQYWP